MSQIVRKREDDSCTCRATDVRSQAHIEEIIRNRQFWWLKKKERSLVKVLPLQGYAQQEVHPYALDQKAHYIVALISRSRLL